MRRSNFRKRKRAQETQIGQNLDLFFLSLVALEEGGAYVNSEIGWLVKKAVLKES